VYIVNIDAERDSELVIWNWGAKIKVYYNCKT
jgi:hypothetical protein